MGGGLVFAWCGLCDTDGSVEHLCIAEGVSKTTAIYLKAHEGLAHDKDVSAAVVTMANDMKIDWTPSRLGFVSFGFFILGLATIAGSLIRAGN